MAINPPHFDEGVVHAENLAFSVRKADAIDRGRDSGVYDS